MRKFLASLHRFDAAQSGMTAIGFGLLSAIIGLVIFGSAMALGFQVSTSFAPFAGPAESHDVSIRETSVSYRAAEDSGETSGMAVPAALKGAISAPPMARSSAGDALSDQRLAFGGVSTGAERAAAKDSARFRPISNPAPGTSGAATAPANGFNAVTRAPAGSGLVSPLAGAITTGRKASQGKRTAFETSTPMQLGNVGDGADGDTVIFEYPIPPIPANSELQLGEDPLAAAAHEVPQGSQRPLGAGFALLAPAAAATAAPQGDPRPADVGLWSGNFVLSFNLTDDQLMLVFMVTGLIAIAAFLWLASSWLGDRSSLKRQRQWERQQAAALAEAEEADSATNGVQERVAA